jgi:hypothetical protein
MPCSDILIPEKQLFEVCEKVVDLHRDQFRKTEPIPDNRWSYISNKVAPYFYVSPITAETQINEDKIPTKISIIG